MKLIYPHICFIPDLNSKMNIVTFLKSFEKQSYEMHLIDLHQYMCPTVFNKQAVESLCLNLLNTLFHF